MISAGYLSWVVILIGFLYSLFLCSSIPKDVFFNGDGSLKAILARQLSQGKLRFDLIETTAPWIHRLWQDGLYAYQSPFIYYLNQRYYVSFPFPFSLLTSLFYKLLGYRGFYFVPLVSAWALWVSFYGIAASSQLESWGIFLWLLILIFSSPLTLYSAMYWEHTLATTLGFVGIAIAFFTPDTANPGLFQGMLGGCLVGLSVWFRSECLALVAALTLLILLGLTPQQTFIWQWFTNQLNVANLLLDNDKSLIFLAGMVGSVILFWLCNKLIYNRFLGIHALLILDEFSWSKRIKEASTSLQQLNTSLIEYFPVCLFPLAYLLTLSLQKADASQESKLIFMGLTGILLLISLAAILSQGIGRAKNLIKKNSIYFLLFLAASYFLSKVELPLTKQMSFIYALYLAYTVGVSCLVDFAPGEVTVGGKQWGARYLLPMIPFVTWLIIEQIQFLWQSHAPLVANGSLAVLLILLGMGVYKNVFQGVQYLSINYQGIAPAIKAIEKDASPIVVFSHQYAAQALGFGLREKKTFFCVEDSQQMIKLCQALVEQGLSHFFYVCYPYRPCQLLQAKPQKLKFNKDNQLFQIDLSYLETFGKYPIYDVVICPASDELLTPNEADHKTTFSQPVSSELVCTILPTYNERDNIAELIELLLESAPSLYLILVVDDNSPDETWKLVEEIAQQYPIPVNDAEFKSSVTLLRRIDEKGLTSALQRGIDEAINTYGAKIVTWMDCDLSMPPEDVPKLIKSIQNHQADVAVGSRWIPGGDDVAHGMMARGLSWIINQMAILLLGDQVHDYTSGFIAARSEVFQQIRLKGDYGEYCIDFLCRASRLDYKLVEVSYLCVPRIHGESKTGINLWDYLDKGRNYVTTIWQLWLER